MEEKISHLEGRVGGLERQVMGLSDQFGKMDGKLDKLIDNQTSSSKTNWPVLASFVSAGIVVLGLLGTWALMPVRNAIDDLKATETRIQQDLVPRQEHRDRWQSQKEDNTDLTSRMLRGFDVVNRRIERLENNVWQVKPSGR